MDIFHHVSNDFQILLHKFDALKKEEKSRCTKSPSSEKRQIFHINKQLKCPRMLQKLPNICLLRENRLINKN